MKRLLALVLVMVLALGALTACSPKETFTTVKDKTVDTFKTVKKTVLGWVGIEVEDETNDDANAGDNNNDGGNTDTPAKKNYAEQAVNNLNIFYGEVDPKTPSDYTLMAKIALEGGAIMLDVLWKSSDESVVIAPKDGDDTLVTVTVPKVENELKYTLTATVTDADGNTKSISFDRIVPSVNTYMSPAEYYAAETGAAIKVQGIVTGIISKTKGQDYNQIYVNDPNYQGGYYVYDISEESIDDIQVGMTVKVTGLKEKTSYNEQRITDAVIDILDSTIKTVNPVDYTTIYQNAADLLADSLVGKAGMLVTLKGVEITGVNEEKKYYHFKLGEKESYVRLSSSTCCLTDEEKTDFIATHAANNGNLADVTGVIATYDKKFYIVPVSVDAYSNFQVRQLSAEEKIAAEFDKIKFDTVKSDKEIALTVAGTTYKDVTISWTSDNTCAVVSADGTKLFVSIMDTAQTVTLTASAKIGDMEPVVKTFTLKVNAISPYVVEAVEAPVVGTEYYLYLYHTNRGEDMFFTGKMGDGNNRFYYGTTSDITKAVKVVLEDAGVVDGTQYYYLKGETETGTMYFNIVSSYDATAGYIRNNVTIDFGKISKFELDTKYNALKTTTTAYDEKQGKDVTNTFIFGTSASKTYNTISANKYSDAGSMCIAQLVTAKNTADMTDEEKVDAQLDKLVYDTTVNNDAKEKVVALLPRTVKGTTLEWSVNKWADIVEGKLVITLGRLEKTVILTATVTAGEVTKTKEFSFVVPQLLPIEPVYTYEEDQGYLLVGQNANGSVYFSGSVTNKRMDGTYDINEAHYIYVKYADETKTTFYLYYYEDGSDKPTYIYAKGNNTAGYYTSDTIPTTVWFVDTANHNAIVSVEDPNADTLKYRMISTQIKGTSSGYSNYSFYALSNAGKSDYFVCFLAIRKDVPDFTPAEKVEDTKQNLTLGTTEVKLSTEITLPTSSHTDVTISWTANNDCVAVNNGKLVVTVPQGLAEDVVVKITANITYGEGETAKTDSKEFELTILALTAAEKVAEEKATLAALAVTTTAADIKIPLPKKTFADVTLTWATNSDYVAVNGNYLVVTLPAAAGEYTVVVTATITCGEGDAMETATKEYELKLKVPAYTVKKAASVEVGKAYKLYLYQTAKVKNLFFTGKKSGNYFATSEMPGAAVDVYLEAAAAEKTYYLYFTDADGKKTYLDMYEYQTDKIGVKFSDTPGAVYFFSEDFGTILSNIKTASYDNDYYFGAYGTNYNIGASSTYYVTGNKAGDLGISQYLAFLVTYECEHDYVDVCDSDCGKCGATRVAAHKWADECDAECDCGVTREAPHKWATDCDTACDCGATRETTAEHDWANDPCDAECVCGATREAPHKWASDCDTACDCGATRAALAAHAYDGCDDTDCGACGATREATEHSYSADCDATCNNVGCDNVRDAAAHVDTDGNDVCDRPGCAAELGSITPDVDVDVEDAQN